MFGVIGSPGFAVDGELLRHNLRRIVSRGIHPAGTARQLLAILASGDRRALLARIVAPLLPRGAFPAIPSVLSPLLAEAQRLARLKDPGSLYAYCLACSID